jgi:hypothetical protein
MGIHMAGLQEKAATTKSSSKPSPFVSGSLHHYSTCYRSSGRSRMFKLMLGHSFLAALLNTAFATIRRGVRGCSILPFGGPRATCGSRLLFCSSSYYSAFSASSSSSLCLRLHPPRYVLSLSLSLTTTSRFSRAVPAAA